MTQDEFQLLREENAALREEHATLRALVAELLPLKAQIEHLNAQVKQLESRLAKDSHHSHLPPSSDRFVRQPKTKSLRKASDKKPGAQPGHKGSTLYQVSAPDQIIVHVVEECAYCHQNLHSEPVLQVKRRQMLDIPPKRLVVLEYQAEQKSCPHCQQINTAPWPSQVSAPGQYGPAFGALAVSLVQQQLLPSERACETIQDLIGPSMTVGTLKGLVDRCAQHLEPVEVQIKDHLCQRRVRHQDETGLDVMGKRVWMHVRATDTLTHSAVHPKRGSEALEAIGILPGLEGISVPDGWTSSWLSACRHALGKVHHLRELICLHEQHQQEWALEMKALLLLMHEAVQQAKASGLQRLNPVEVADWKAQYEAILKKGWQANLPDPPAVDGVAKRGRRKHSATRNLVARLSKHQDAVLRFLNNCCVPFDKSQAESDLRMVPRSAEDLWWLPLSRRSKSLLSHSWLCVHGCRK